MRSDAVSRRGLSPLQKCVATIHILAYRSPADSVNEYVSIAECTVIQCFEAFVKDANGIFGDDCLRRTTTITSIIYYKLEIHMGPNNHINGLNQSSAFNNTLQDRAPSV
ncbi:hypothetical protein GmHk_07G019043 [Glycine max]|nr:hypothetical protein GmHk_07G019043 [Glycine max]